MKPFDEIVREDESKMIKRGAYITNANLLIRHRWDGSIDTSTIRMYLRSIGFIVGEDDIAYVYARWRNGDDTRLDDESRNIHLYAVDHTSFTLVVYEYIPLPKEYI